MEVLSVKMNFLFGAWRLHVSLGRIKPEKSTCTYMYNVIRSKLPKSTLLEQIRTSSRNHNYSLATAFINPCGQVSQFASQKRASLTLPHV